MYESYFDGSTLQLIIYRILGYIFCICTLGIVYPWIMCIIYKWEASHTVINGQRLYFDGTALSLFKRWFKWLILCFITFGLYSIFVYIDLKKWKISHTHFED